MFTFYVNVVPRETVETEAKKLGFWSTNGKGPSSGFVRLVVPVQ
jgi:hypothetical protein